jgi:hypothetical protein
MRECLKSELKDVPEELRAIVIDHVITGLSVGYFKSRVNK